MSVVFFLKGYSNENLILIPEYGFFRVEESGWARRNVQVLFKYLTRGMF